MRSFRDHPAFQAFDHKHKDKILLYIELMYAVGSDLNKIDNLEERKRTAASRSGLVVAISGDALQTIFAEEDDSFNALRHAFLSSYQFHNKYQNLITYQQMLWNVQHAALNEADEDKKFQVMDKQIDLLEKLEGLVARLFSEIYGDGKTIEIAKDNIRQAMAPEERLKQTKTTTKP